jgi:hypothetical protein
MPLGCKRLGGDPDVEAESRSMKGMPGQLQSAQLALETWKQSLQFQYTDVCPSSAERPRRRRRSGPVWDGSTLRGCRHRMHSRRGTSRRDVYGSGCIGRQPVPGEKVSSSTFHEADRES